MSTTRLRDLAEKAAEVIRGEWENIPDRDHVRVCDQEEFDAESLPGRRVYVWEQKSQQVGRVSRDMDIVEHRMTVCVADKWLKTGTPPEDWIDGVKGFATGLWDRLSDDRQPDPLPGETTGSLVPESYEPANVRAVDALQELKVFYTSCELVYREYVGV